MKTYCCSSCGHIVSDDGHMCTDGFVGVTDQAEGRAAIERLKETVANLRRLGGNEIAEAIDWAIRSNAQIRNIIYNVEQRPDTVAVPDLLRSLRSAIGLQPGERA